MIFRCRTAVTSRLEDESLGNSKTIAGVKRTKKSATDAPQALLSTYVCSRERTTGAPGTETSRKRKGTTNVIKAKRAREGVSVKKEEHSVKKEEQSEDEHKARISVRKVHIGDEYDPLCFLVIWRILCPFVAVRYDIMLHPL